MKHQQLQPLEPLGETSRLWKEALLWNGAEARIIAVFLVLCNNASRSFNEPGAKDKRGKLIVARAALLKRACDGDEAAIRRFVACRKPCLPNTGPACTACFERLSHERAIVGPPALVAGAVVITHASLLFSTGVPAPKNLIANRRASCEGLVLERVRDCDAWLVQHDHGTAVYLPGEFTRRLEGAP